MARLRFSWAQAGNPRIWTAALNAEPGEKVEVIALSDGKSLSPSEKPLSDPPLKPAIRASEALRFTDVGLNFTEYSGFWYADDCRLSEPNRT